MMRQVHKKIGLNYSGGSATNLRHTSACIPRRPRTSPRAMLRSFRIRSLYMSFISRIYKERVEIYVFYMSCISEMMMVRIK